MVSAARHNELVDFIVNNGATGGASFGEYMDMHFSDFSIEDLQKALVDAKGMIAERSLMADVYWSEMLEFSTLFESREQGESAIDTARRKAAEGNELAIEFLKWCEE